MIKRLHLSLLSLCLVLAGCGANQTPSPTRESDRIIPTSTPAPEPTAVPTMLPTADSTLISLDETAQAIINTAEFERFGVSGHYDDALAAYEVGIRYRHLFTWLGRQNAPLPDGATFWQTVRVNDREYDADMQEIDAIAAANPGSYWLIGNEPDVRWQDNQTPQQYADRYHAAYTAIKAADPTAKLVAGSVSQGTPLRLRWLDEVLAAYQATYSEPFPADLWSVHAYVLREERDSWGVDIPPGLTDVDTGELYEIDDHDDLELFAQNILSFRRWMATNSYDVPLAVTEFGILLPNDYGFPPDLVADYMRDSFDILLEMTDDSGFSADNNRVAQFWFWYIVEDEQLYPTGNLYDSETREPTFLGEAWIDYITAPPDAP